MAKCPKFEKYSSTHSKLTTNANKIINARKCTPRHITVKLLKAKDQEKNFESNEKKRTKHIHTR